MDHRVQDLLNQKRWEAMEAKKREKEEFLRSLGLTEKVYSPHGFYTDEYRLSEWDKEQKKQRYYKIAPAELTDEEYEELKKACGKTGESSVAKALDGIALSVYILGALAGLITMFNVDFLSGLAVALGAFVSGTLFRGFAEIIRLLEEIRDNTEGK